MVVLRSGTSQCAFSDSGIRRNDEPDPLLHQSGIGPQGGSDSGPWVDPDTPISSFNIEGSQSHSFCQQSVNLKFSGGAFRKKEVYSFLLEKT